MGRLWRCSLCIGLTVLTTLPHETQAIHNDLYQMHRLKKTHEIVRHQRRDPSCQLDNWSLCPASVGGGCCPDRYACDTDSCFVATAGPTTACMRANYYQCPIERGLGCCPLGTICSEDGQCNSPDGSPYQVSCPASYYACPVTVGGCCRSGMACGDGYCYETRPATYSVSSTITTTNSNGDTVTTTVTEATVITPGPGPGTSNPSNPINTFEMVFPSTVSKLPAAESGSGQGIGGLTKAQIGGVVAGVVIILIAILLATFFIIRRLKKTARIVAAVESKRDTSSGGQQRSRKTSFGQPTITEVDGFDVDPLMQSPSVRPSHLRSESDGSFTDRSPNCTPNMPSTVSTPPLWSSQYNAVAPISEAPSEGRDYSIDFFHGAYDVSRYSQQTENRISYDSQMSHGHSRQHSNASELSGSTVDGPGKSELDSSNVVEQDATATAAGRRRASTSAATARSPPPSLSHIRRSSGGAARGRSESAAAAIALDTVNEFGELHGFYGPPDQAVGQTAERLGRGGSTASSTASRDIKEAAARLRRGDSSVTATPIEAYDKSRRPPLR